MTTGTATGLVAAVAPSSAIEKLRSGEELDLLVIGGGVVGHRDAPWTP